MCCVFSAGGDLAPSGPGAATGQESKVSFVPYSPAFIYCCVPEKMLLLVMKSCSEN